MAGKRDKKGPKGAIIVRKYEADEAAHHGGAWKVAYADFVTAMMAFFLLMWLLNATTEEQRKGLADYFSPTNLMSHSSSGTGEPFGGHTAFDDGAMVSDRGAVQVTVGKRPIPENVAEGTDPVTTEYHRAPAGEGVGQGPLAENRDADDEQKTQGEAGDRRPPGADGPADTKTQGDPATKDSAAAKQADLAKARDALQEAERQEKLAFAAAAEQIKLAVKSDPALADLAKQLAIDITPEGLRIQIMDEVKEPMFPSGSAQPNDRARLLIQKVAPVLMKLDHPISIAGHTDATPFPGPDRTNWELSSERANATRRLLTDSGFPEDRVESVTGHAAHDPLLPADPMAAANRRIAILVRREVPAPEGRLPPIEP
jgi:chemotaxis protein MotB